MKTTSTTHRARLRLPGTAALANSSHGIPNVMPPPKPLRRILTGLAAALTLGLFALPGVSRADTVPTWTITSDTTWTSTSGGTGDGLLTVTDWGHIGYGAVLNQTGGKIDLSNSQYGIIIGQTQPATYNMSGNAILLSNHVLLGNGLSSSDVATWSLTDTASVVISPCPSQNQPGDLWFGQGNQAAGTRHLLLSGAASFTVTSLSFNNTGTTAGNMNTISFATGSTATFTAGNKVLADYQALVTAGNIRVDGMQQTNFSKFQVTGTGGHTLSLAPQSGPGITATGSPLPAVRSIQGTASTATSSAADLVASPPARQVLWYDSPAQIWESQALPIGNGRLGAMIFGAADKETIQLNEDSLWEGDEKDTGWYQNLGEFEVTLPRAKPAENYRRELDISRALHAVTYTSDGVAFRREAFASFPDQVMVFRFTADKPGSHSGTLTLKDGRDVKPVIGPNRMTAAGKLKNGLQYESQILVINDGGTLTATPAGIAFQNVNSLTLMVGAGTDYLNQRAKGWRSGEAPHRLLTEQIDKAAKRPYAALLAAHVKDYQALFKRVALDNGKTDAAIAVLPIPKRLEAYKQANAKDPELENLLFQYGRYLLMGSSRGALPANLQGLWNNSNTPPWRSDYHSNINIQMNYWLSEAANLPECAEPLLNYIFSLREVRTEQTSAEFKSKRGWTVQTENNIFGGSSWEWNTPGSAWYCQHLWEHYAFGGDKTYLKTVAYPVMKEVCEFWEDRLKALPDGTLVAPMGFSPEQGPREDGVSFDQEIIWDLFTNYIEASQALGVDPEYCQKIIAMRDKLLVPKIGKWGQLQEWMVDRDDPNNQHRHVSHLFALHPGRQISPTKTPVLAEAAKVSLTARGDDGTGWSKAWKINFWARLLDGDHSYKMYSELLKNNIMLNLFDTHPPFQMDGNFGATAGVCEMLLQSQAGELHLLPALPGAWPNGSVTGLRARGGFEVDMAWADCKLTSVTLRSHTGKVCQVRYGKKTVEMKMQPGAVIRLSGDLSTGKK